MSTPTVDRVGFGPRFVVATSAGSVLNPVDSSIVALRHDTPLWILVAVGTGFGIQNGLAVVTNQAVMYAQAPAGQTGTAAGLLRTFMYLGAIASAAVLGSTFGDRATDAGLHRLAAILTVAAVALLASVLLDRDLPHDGSAGQARRQPGAVGHPVPVRPLGEHQEPLHVRERRRQSE